MKRTLLTAFALLALALGACNQDSTVNGPVAAPDDALITAAQQLDLDDAQTAEVVDMFYLGEDMNAIMTSAQSSSFESFIASATPAGGDRLDPRQFLDIEALMYFRLIMRANPDMTAEEKAAIQALIRAANEARMKLIADETKTRAEKAEGLKAIHNRLMGAINEKLTTEQLANTRALLERIAQQRKEMHERLLEARIRMQIRTWDQYLKFTDRQKAAIADILRAQDKAIQEARERFKDSPEEFRAALQAIQKRADAAIAGLLTERQLVIWNRLRGRTGG